MPIDNSNMLEVLHKFPQQCREALSLPKGMVVSDVDKIVVAGMGGSAIGGDLLKACLHDGPVPVEVNRDYKLPGYVNQKTLVFAVSYSGNTEETIGAIEDALNKKTRLVGISSGGSVSEICDPCITIPSGFQPRAALAYLFLPMLGICHSSGLTRVKNDDVNEMLALLKKVDEHSNLGEALSKKIKDKVPLVYSSQKLMPACFRWKTQINENAKWPAFYNVFSEMNHNEIAATPGLDRKFIAVFIRDKDDHPQIRKRMDICKAILEERVDVEEYWVQGKSLLAKLMSTIYTGDFLSYHLAIWRRVDPTPVEVIEGMKRKLK